MSWIFICKKGAEKDIIDALGPKWKTLQILEIYYLNVDLNDINDAVADRGRIR